VTLRAGSEGASSCTKLARAAVSLDLMLVDETLLLPPLELAISPLKCPSETVYPLFLTAAPASVLSTEPTRFLLPTGCKRPVLSFLQLANAFFTGGLLTTSEAQALMPVFPQTFGAQYTRLVAAKLGLREFDGEFTTALLALMKRDKVDFTNLFRALGNVTTGLDVGSAGEEELLAPIQGVLGEGGVKGDWAQWMRIYIVKVGRRYRLI
jgi:hypothetical protein